MAKEEKQQTSDEIIIRKIFILRSEKVILICIADVMRAKGCVRVTEGVREANEEFVEAMRTV